MSGAEPPISVDGVGVAYRVPHHRSVSLKERIVRPLSRDVTHAPKWGVRGVTFEVAAGEIFGVIGPNGAGKSTLMKALARVVTPAEGRIVVRGAVAPLIELGAGFDLELTGRENIVLYGALLGYPPAEMRRRVGSIAEWAGLEAELDVPVRTYSTGMLARLAFGTATAIVPRVLLIDETLSVGDEAFRKRSWLRIRDLIEEGAAVVLVSHELWAIEALCREVLWLDGGRPRALGPPKRVVQAYTAAAAAA